MDFKGFRYVIVGSGFFGATVAQCLAEGKHGNVAVIEKRDHVGGNCFSETDRATGIEYHAYGTHVFHTSRREVQEYFRRFADFNGYRHQVLARHGGRVFQMPINLDTVNSFYGTSLTPPEVDGFLRREAARERRAGPSRNFEEQVVRQIGRPLYEAFIRGYTVKQWGRDPRALPASIIRRLPFRKDYDRSYFFDRWQGVPETGYAALFKKMLGNERIDVRLKTDYFAVRDRIPASCTVIYSGPIDRFFDFKHGRLEWRSVRFEREVVSVGDYQGTAVMNYTDEEIPFTRIHEPRHLHPERRYPRAKTLIIREYPQHDGAPEPFYPVRDSRNLALLNRYLREARALKNVHIGGRLGDYQYYDIDATIARALELCARLARKGR